MVNKASISVNKLGEYITSKGARQRRLLHDRKYPDPEFQMGTYHREASDAVSRYIAGGCIDTAPLDKQLQALEQLTPEKVGTARRINANIDALERFYSMLDDVNLLGATPEMGAHNPTRLTLEMGAHNPTRLTFHNVEISVRPEIVLRTTNKGKNYVGAWKLHFSKTHPHSEESAGFVSAAVQEYARLHVAAHDEVINPLFCPVIDVASGTVFVGVKATKQRLADISAECLNIAALWPTI